MLIKLKSALAGILLLASAFVCSAQTSIDLSGKITDAESGEAVAGAVVHLHETNAVAVTDANGNYKIPDVRKGTYHLHVHMIGYEELKQTVSIRENIRYNFALKPAAIQMHEIVVESEYLKAARKELTLPVEIIGEEHLEEQLSATLAQALEKVPGITSINTGVGISKPVMRGFTGPRVLVNEQGIQQQGQDWGQDHGLEMDPFSIERVEVIKGPATVMYGSGAIGGVINILPPTIPTANSSSAEVAAIYRSVNNTFGSFASIKGNKNNNYYILKGSFQDFGDYYIPASNFIYNGFVLPVYNNSLKNTAGNEVAGSATAGVLRNWGNARISVSNYHQQVGLFPGAVGTPRYYHLIHDGNTRNIDLPRQVNNHFKILGHVQVMLKNNWLEVDAGYQKNLRREESRPHGHGQQYTHDSVALDLDLQTFSLRPKYHLVLDSLTKLVTGLDANYKINNIAGFEFLIPRYKEGNVAAFFLVNREINNRLNVSAGFRTGFSTMDIKSHTVYYYDANGNVIREDQRSIASKPQYFNYSATIGANWLWRENLTLRLNAGRSFRNPNIAELAENGIHHGTFRHEKGDATINPEQGWQFDAGLTLEKKKFTGSFTSYYNYFDNYIFLRPMPSFSPLPGAGQLYQYTQAKAIHTGFEVFADFHPIRQMHLSNIIEYIYTYNLESNLPLPFIPPLTNTTSAAWEWDLQKNFIKKIKAGAEYEFRAAQKHVERNESPTSESHFINIYVTSKFTVKKQLIHLNIKVNNVVNSMYFNHISRYRMINLPEPGRNVNLLIKIPVNANLPHVH